MLDECKSLQTRSVTGTGALRVHGPSVCELVCSRQEDFSGERVYDEEQGERRRETSLHWMKAGARRARTHTQHTHTHTHARTHAHTDTHTDTDKHTHTNTHAHAHAHALAHTHAKKRAGAFLLGPCSTG